eukprot:gene21091-23151_t
MRESDIERKKIRDIDVQLAKLKWRKECEMAKIKSIKGYETDKLRSVEEQIEKLEYRREVECPDLLGLTCNDKIRNLNRQIENLVWQPDVEQPSSPVTGKIRPPNR